MNEFSRRGFLGLAGAAGVAGLAACAGTGTAPSTGSGGGSSNTIEFWSNHPGNSKPVEQEIIKAFEAANSGLKVKLVDAGKNYEEVAQKFNASLAGGQLPDVVVVSDVTWFNFALNKQLSPLDELLSTAKIDTSDYVDALYNDYNLDDKHYALPFSRSTPLFYYNKDLWKAAGLEDRGPKDWDEFLTWAPKLKAAAGSDKIVMELPDGSNYLDWVFQNMVWGHGGAYSKEWTPTLLRPQHGQGRHLPAEPRQERLPQAVQGPGARLHGRHRRLQHDVDRIARRRRQGREVPGGHGVPAR